VLNVAPNMAPGWHANMPMLHRRCPCVADDALNREASRRPIMCCRDQSRPSSIPAGRAPMLSRSTRVWAAARTRGHGARFAFTLQRQPWNCPPDGGKLAGEEESGMTIALRRRSLVTGGLLTGGLVTGGLAAAALASRPARAQRPAAIVRIGVLTDLSGTYRDSGGPTTVACVRQAVQEFTAGKDMTVEVLAADFLNKPDVGAGIARQWFDQNDVDVIVDLINSAVALAVSGVGREKNKVILVSGAATSELTGKQCSPNTVHWTYDTWMLAKSTATNTLKAGGDTWYLLAPDYAFGHQLAQDTARFVNEAGGKVLGTAFYPFPDTTDFSAFLQQAEASGAKVFGLCTGSGSDAVNCIKQVHEFGLPEQMQVASMLIALNTVRALGLETAKGLHLTESFYWDLNDRTRAFMDRIRPKTPSNWPAMFQAGNYAATLHYLKAVADMGVAAAKADGRAVVERMKALPTDDDCFGKGHIREDGRKIHPSYLFQVKAPAESARDWDFYRLIATTPADQAFRPLSEGGCPLVHG
jgi:branched-chain amino acid transport system substrate-binding protein